MLEPAVCDFSIVRGTTEPVTFYFHNQDDGETPIPFDDVEFVISRNNATGPTIFRLTLLGGGLQRVEIDGRDWIRWTPTEAQSRLIPVGRLSHYEVQLTTGATRRVYLIGRITGIGGLNDDDG